MKTYEIPDAFDGKGDIVTIQLEKKHITIDGIKYKLPRHMRRKPLENNGVKFLIAGKEIWPSQKILIDYNTPNKYSSATWLRLLFDIFKYKR